MRVNLDLKTPGLAWRHFRSMLKAFCFEGLAECQHVWREGAAEIGRIASGVMAPELLIQLSLSQTGAGLVRNHQRCIHRYSGVFIPGLRQNPLNHLWNPLQPRHCAQA